MATNDFLPFAAAGGANVLSQADWLALASRLSGYTAGVASSQQLNKTWRQSAAMAAMIGQFINDYGVFDALDDGNIANLETSFVRTLMQASWSRVVASGSANAWTVTTSPAVAAYTSGRPLWVKAPATNTSTTVTINISGLGTRPLKKADATDPAIGDFISGRWYQTIDDGTNVCVLSTLPSDVVSAGAIVGRTQIFTASGTFTVPAGVTSAEVEGWGAGGSGGASGDGVGLPAGSAGAGGGAGGYFYKRVFGLAPGSTVAVTVGAGGLPLADASQYPPPASQTGGSTSFGAYATATGGKGGPSGRNALIAGGDGGTSTGGDMNIVGARGGTGGPTGTFQAEYTLHVFNKGGLPGRPIGNVDSFGTGAAGRSFGTGGNGASGGSAVAGGAGAPGLLIVRW